MAQHPFNEGSFVPTTPFLDDRSFLELNPNSFEFKDFIVKLRNALNKVELVLNTKDTGKYVTQEFVNGQQFFANPSLSSTTQQNPTPRQVYRKVINFGALPNAATKSTAHGITMDANFSITRLYGAATNPNTSFIPLPYAHTTAANSITLNADTTNINVTTGIDYTAYTTTYIIIEYITH